ncbi:MAG TPA: tRNA lysidine(34) synthetase TilS [Candidatus Acidoferrales bacterium]|nr:tRNA lysidine(34) synthetase TilS [Candidatus Acidoferrales bacterium]
MGTKLVERIVETIRRHNMLRPGDRVGVGVSGGADSVALLLLLDELKAALGISLVVVHFNHCLRGMDSDADEHFVATLATAKKLEFASAREDVAARAQQQGWNLEDAARRLRYEYFSTLVASGRATRMAVAHTADDQAETVLAHLLRGTGLSGLAAIYPVAGIIVRPLLGIRRQELRDYLSGRKQPWREDPTNLDTTRLRARIRHHLLPQLERDFQPAVVPRLGQLATLAHEDEASWAALVDDCYRKLVERAPAGHSIRVQDLLSPFCLDPAVAWAPDRSSTLRGLSKRLVRRIYEGLKGDRRQLTSGHVEQVLHLATASESGHLVHLPAGVAVERSFDHLIFSPSRFTRHSQSGLGTESAGQPYEYVVHIAGEGSTTVSIPEIGRRFRLKTIDWPPAERDTRFQIETLDADRLRWPLILRSWRPGDSYRPRGRRRVRKLKRLLLESRVTARERKVWPVLTSAGALAWARGLPVAEEFAARAETKSGLVIAEEAL